MATYELDDDIVRWVVANWDLMADEAEKFRDSLARQIPLPIPSKIGAVVKTTKPYEVDVVFIRWATDNTTLSPWIEAGNHEVPYRTDEIGRITEVLSEGADV